MRVLVTGAKGFIGKNLCEALRRNDIETLEIDVDNLVELPSFIQKADWIVNLAGINRPLKKEEFYDGNFNFPVKLVEEIKKTGRKIPVILSSSTQAEKDNDYGKSKKMAEDFLFSFMKETGNPVYVYRFQNVFGKWCRPSYNSVVATFCYNITHSLPIQVNDPSSEICFVYIDDIVVSILSLLKENNPKGEDSILSVSPSYKVTLGHLVELLNSFHESRKTLSVPTLDGGFESKLYATYLSYLDAHDFSYKLTSHSDNRGSFTEILRLFPRGQASVNVIKPGITKGNHYHNTKVEKYLVLSGECSTKFRKIGTDEVISYDTNGKEFVVIDIPAGYTHSITNIGNEDSIVFMWASEPFDPNHPDTYMEEVIKHE